MKATFSPFTRLLAVSACVLSLAACSDMNKTQQRTLSGAGIGAGVGAAGTVMTGGCVSCGAAVGAAVGAGAGYVYDQTHKDKK
jgi:osmotically inducible lipoprotein OsmB